MRRAEIKPLTSLRFFAAAAIVAHHAIGSFEIPRPAIPFDHAVPFFFVLSGFILTYNYEDLPNYRPTSFIVSRFARIWPVHLVCLFLGFILIPYFRSSAATGDGWLILLANVFMVHDWIPSYRFAFSFNGVSWSISAEMFFYLAFPFLIVSRKRMVIGLLVFLALVLVILFISRDLRLDPSVPIYEKNAFLVWAHLHPTASIVGFILGMLGASIFRSLQNLKLNVVPGTIVESAALALCIWWFWKGSVVMYPRGLSDVGRVYYSYNSAFMVAPIIVLVFAWSSGLVSRVLSWEPLVVLGKISFSTYMLHQILIRAAMHYALPTKIGHFNALLLTILVAYLGSWLMWRLVEEPMRHKLTAVYRYFATRRTPSKFNNTPSM